MATQLPPKRVDAQTRPATLALVAALEDAVQEIIGAVAACEHPELVRVDDWTVKDTLGHIAFWHESFARNVNALIEGNKPSPLRGKYVEINQRSVDETKALTTEQIMSRLKIAHRIIQENILSEKLKMIPYRKGSRDYTPEEHLDIVNRHIGGHLKSIEKAIKGRQIETA